MIRSSTEPHILVVRNDKLGDFMLTFPAFALLKQSLPQAQVYALVPPYTREMAEDCAWIDHIITDPGEARSMRGVFALSQQLRDAKLDAVISLFSTTRTGLAVYTAGIPLRIAPATKLAQLFYNQRLTQRRSRSEKPEYEYNLDLVRHFLKTESLNIERLKLTQATEISIQPPYLSYDANEIDQLKQTFCINNQFDSQHPIIFIHPGHGGSANNLSLAQYAQLAQRLSTMREVNIVITAGPEELSQAQQLPSLDKLKHCTIYHSTEGLRRFAQHIQFADLFISGSTGPLHIAGALNTATTAFYPRRQSATSLRWQTLNSEDKRLVFSPPANAEENEMSAIDMDLVAKEISAKFLTH